jgi:hypothetical protein
MEGLNIGIPAKTFALDEISNCHKQDISPKIVELGRTPT